MNPQKTAARKQQPQLVAPEDLIGLVRELGREMQCPASQLDNLSLNTSIDRDLGLDSVTRVELLGRVERHFGVHLDTAELIGISRLGDLYDAVLQARPDSAASHYREQSQVSLEAAEAEPSAVSTLPDLLQWHCEQHAERPHIQLFSDHGEGEQISYGELLRGASTMARRLQEDGLAAGERVAIMLPTGRDYFFSFFAVLFAGAVPVSLYPPFRISQLEDHLRRHEKILNNCGASRLIAFPEVRQFARLMKAQSPQLKTVYSAADLSGTESVIAPRIRSDDLAFLQYTSGSTGNPKGVMLSHHNLLSNVRAMGERMEVGSRDVITSWLPLYHDMGLIGCWLGSLYYACLFVVMSPMDFLTRPERWLWAIHRYRGSISAAPNFAYELCLKRIPPDKREGLDLSSWRIACNGAEAVSAHTLRRFYDRYRHYGLRRETLMPVYGLAENSVGLTFPPLDRGPLIDRLDREVFSRSGHAQPATANAEGALEFPACGSPLPDNDVRIVDELNREVPERHEGDLQFRSDSATRGYYNNPGETRKLFRGEWLNSGDRAYMVGGEVFITGRSKDIIIHGGRNLYPQELEEAVGGIEGVRKGCVAVFASRDRKHATEKLMVLAETRESGAAERRRMREAIVSRAVDIVGMAPDEVVLAEPHAVLKTSSGKVRRAATRAAWEQGRLGSQQRSLLLQMSRMLAVAALPESRRALRRLGSWLYGAWFWFCCALVVPPAWLSLLLVPRRLWRWRLAGFWCRCLFLPLGIRFSLGGAEHLASTGRAVLVANHSSYLDVFVLIRALRQPCTFVAKAELQSVAPLRLLLRRMGVEFVDRQDRQQGAEDAKRLQQRAAQGDRLLFFPEGTFGRTRGLYPFHMGAFLTAVEAAAPVLPVAIIGSRDILYPESWWPRPGRVRVEIGAACLPTGEGRVWERALAQRDAARSAILAATGDADLGRQRPAIW